MKLLKLGFISAIILFVIVTIIGLLFPSKVIVSRAIDISQSRDSIFALTNNLMGWQKWVEGLDNKKINTPLQTNIGNSTIVILSATKEKITAKWIEKNGDEQLSSIYLISAAQYQTIVNWQFEQDVKWYPWARLTSMLNEKVIGYMMEKNLATLKKVAENK